MIELNITLFFQILHFLITWWMLDTFLFPYLVKEADAENIHKKMLENGLIEQQILVKSLSEKIKLQWEQYQKLFRKHNPDICAYRSTYISHYPQQKNLTDTITQQELEVIAAQTADHITKQFLTEEIIP